MPATSTVVTIDSVTECTTMSTTPQSHPGRTFLLSPAFQHLCHTWRASLLQRHPSVAVSCGSLLWSPGVLSSLRDSALMCMTFFLVHILNLHLKLSGYEGDLSPAFPCVVGQTDRHLCTILLPCYPCVWGSHMLLTEAGCCFPRPSLLPHKAETECLRLHGHFEV